MSESKEITGIEAVDHDLAKLIALGEDKPRLKLAKSVIADENASLEKVTSAVGASVIQISVALSDPENAQALLDLTPESGRPALEKAITFIKAHLAGIEKHPAVVRFTNAELARKSEKRDDLKNRIARVRWEPLWEDKKDRLTPTARVSFLDDRDELLLDSTLNWDDLAFVMRTCARILVGLCKKSEPIAKADLLDLSYAQRFGKGIAETQSAIDELTSIASILGIDLSKSTAEQAVDDPSEPGDTQ